MSSAVTKPRAPRIPSDKELIQAIRNATPGLTVYNPSELWLNPEVHGRLDIWLPPDLNGAVEPHPVTGVPTTCDGTAIIKGRYLTQKDSSGKVISGQDAEAAVRFLIAKVNYGEMGVCWLPRESDAQDADIKQEAKETYAEYQRNHDQMIVDRRAEFVKAWKTKHPGDPAPPPTTAENDSMERLQERRHRLSYSYECDADGCPGYATNDWAKFARHMDVAHKLHVERTRYEETVGTEPEPEPAKRGPGRPRKIRAEE